MDPFQVEKKIFFFAATIEIDFLFRLIQAVFLFPRFLEKNHDKLMTSLKGKYEPLDSDEANQEDLDLIEPKKKK